MNKVFFGGSRKLNRINSAIRERADNIISNNLSVLIGDANGADKAMQKYLAEKSYKTVIVYCVGDTCRNNLGKWQINSITSNSSKKDFNYYATKDKKMSEDADYGFMLWDGESKGTLNNIVNLLQSNKYVLAYFSPAKEFFTLKNFGDLEKLLRKCDQRNKKTFQQILRTHEGLSNTQKELRLA